MAGMPEDLLLRQTAASGLAGPPRAPVPTAAVGELSNLQSELAKIEQQMQMVGGASAQDKMLQQALIRRAMELQDRIQTAQAPAAPVDLEDIRELPGAGAQAKAPAPAAATAQARPPAPAAQKTQEGQMMAKAGIPDAESMFEAIKAFTAEV